MIRKLAGGKYRLYSRKKNPKTGERRNLGTFDTRKAAESMSAKYSISSATRHYSPLRPSHRKRCYGHLPRGSLRSRGRLGLISDLD
jgi:hypothetical protein